MLRSLGHPEKSPKTNFHILNPKWGELWRCVHFWSQIRVFSPICIFISHKEPFWDQRIRPWACPSIQLGEWAYKHHYEMEKLT